MVDTSGDLRIGDTLCQGKDVFEFEKVPSFLPEYFGTVQILDPMKRKQLKKGLEQLSEEGVVQIYRQRDFGDRDPIIAAVGALQFEVLEHRLRAEYTVEVRINPMGFQHARWVIGKAFDPMVFERREDTRCLLDRDDFNVVLFKSDWALRWAQENYKDLEFIKTSPIFV
jgi:peptide chain release factor 3